MKDLFPHYHIGHFVHRPDEPLDFEVVRFEEMTDPDIEDPHKHTFYEILWFDEGHSTQVIDYRSYDIAPGTLFFIAPNQMHEFVEWQPLRGGSIFFTEHFFLLDHPDQDQLFELSFLENYHEQPYLTLDNQSFAQIRQIIELLIGEKNRPDRSDEILRSLLRVLLGHIQRGVVADQKKPNSKRQMVLYRAFRGLLETHFRSNLTASGYADLLHVTQHHLNLVVGQISGRTTSDIIRTRNILEAKRHLTFSDRSVSEIAADLHFFDLSYFGKVFKSETGLSPLDFRKAMSEKYRKQTFPS